VFSKRPISLQLLQVKLGFWERTFDIAAASYCRPDTLSWPTHSIKIMKQATKQNKFTQLLQHLALTLIHFFTNKKVQVCQKLNWFVRAMLPTARKRPALSLVRATCEQRRREENLCEVWHITLTALSISIPSVTSQKLLMKTSLAYSTLITAVINYKVKSKIKQK